MKTFSKFAIVAAAVLSALSLAAAPHGPGRGPGPGPRHAPPPAPHHHHHHHGGVAVGVGAGILGAGLLASTIYDATHPRPVVVSSAPVVVSQPVVVQQPATVVVQQPAPVVVQQPAGHYETRVQNVWVEGRYVDQVTTAGTVVRTWQPGHYEQQTTQVYVP